jgi:peptide/nickel transport system substrate-binding protein
LAWFGPVLTDSDAIDKRLVYTLASRKIPSGEQFRHLRKFLHPGEFLIIKVCALVILVNLVYLGAVFIKEHLQYLPAAGGEYVEGMVGSPQTVNPLYAVNRDVDSDLSRLIYSRLFKYDDSGRLRYDLVDKVAVSADNKEYLVTVKDKVKWHNGGILTTDDVLFTFNLIQNPDYRSPLRSAFSAVTAEKVDDRTIRFRLSTPYAPFLELLTFGILPKSLWENVSPASALLSDLNLKPVGSGPFKFKSLIRNSDGDLKDYTLIAHSDYYGGAPYLKTIDFKFFASAEEAIAALNDKQIMGLNYLSFNNRSAILARNSLQFHELSQPRIISLFFNTSKNKALADKEVRLALAKALDKGRLLNDIFAGIYTRADGPIWSGSSAYNEDLVKYDYAPELAASAIKSKPLSLILTVIDSGNNLAFAEKIRAYWTAVGVKADIKVVASEQAAAMVRDRDFEVLLYGQSVGGDPDVYAFWHSSQAGGRGLNLAAYNNADADKLLAEARITTDPGERQAKYKKFQKIVTGDLPVIFLYSPTYTYVQAKALQGFSGTAIVEPADRFDGAGAWYIKTSQKLTW